jgi:hypothetical protein
MPRILTTHRALDAGMNIKSLRVLSGGAGTTVSIGGNTSARGFRRQEEEAKTTNIKKTNRADLVIAMERYKVRAIPLLCVWHCFISINTIFLPLIPFS